MTDLKQNSAATTVPDIITIDVEEWFHGHNYLEHVPQEIWQDQESRVEKNMRVCFDLLAKHNVKATFFVLGWTAERHPDLVQEIISQGHELASHSYRHPVVFEMSAEEFRTDCLKSLEVLSDAGATDVRGYRAPSFSITEPVHHYLDILQECGFKYDCSIFPVRHSRYGQPDAPRHAFQLAQDNNSLVVVPMPAWRVLGQNVPYSGGAYMRLWPWPVYRMIRKMARRQQVPNITYFHPWELDNFRPDVGLSKATRLRSSGGQDKMLAKLSEIFAAGSFLTLGQYVDQLRQDNKLEVRAAKNIRV